MLDGLLGRGNFKTKCKSALSRTKARLEAINKKRNAMQKFLKTDIAELLKSNLDRNAYGRAEGLYIELNMSSCYDYVEECCTSITNHLKEMHKQSECPEECKVYVASLIYAAARFADLPDLRDLRMQFYDKYGKALEPYVNKEFVEKLKSKPPTMEMKLKLMQDITQELSVTWDPKPLEQQLQDPSMSTHIDHCANSNYSNGAGDERKFPRSRSVLVQINEKKDNVDDETNKAPTVMTEPKMRHSQSWCAHTKDEQNNQDPETSFISRNYDKITNRKPFTNRIVPAPYKMPTKTDNNGAKTPEDEDSSSTNNQKQGESPDRPRPRSVRTKFLKQSQSSVTSSEHIGFEFNDLKETLSARAPRENQTSSSTSTSGASNVNSFGQVVSDLPLPPGRRRYLFPESQPALLLQEADNNIKSELPWPPSKSKFLPPDFHQKEEPSKRKIGHKKSSSFGNDEEYGHGHAQIPDFDELAERVATLRKVQG